ncbi:MAG: hypothetical protein IJI58_04535 [Bacilli bacterium]|nr:hypothetical protein [Bacilli bacterium]
MNSNSIIEREKSYIEEICNFHNYDSNLRHLLYIIIPAFIIKYGIAKEKLILDTFKDIKISINPKESKIIKAYYLSTPTKVNNQYKTTKNMVINNYRNIGLVELLDNLVHEFNHAVNSYVNEIKVTNNYILLRTGLTFRVYNRDLSFVKKDESFILEEIINTKQTEDIINIIKEFDSNDPTIYAINSETDHKYNSNAYYLQSYICKEILNNRTFISTLEKLRIAGEVYDINNWFDSIIGTKGKYKELNKLLNEVYELEISLVDKNLFKKITINKIRSKSRDIMKIVGDFNSNVNFK